MKKKTIIIGSNSFIGKKLIDRLGSSNCIQLSSSIKKNNNKFNLGDDLNLIISNSNEIQKIVLLAWDRRDIKKEGENINIFGIKKIYNFAKNNKIPIYFASSVSAISKVSSYGKNKFLCENIIKQNNLNRILRLGMVVSNEGGLIYKINKLFSYLPIIFIPGNGSFKVNFVKIETVVEKFLLNPERIMQTVNVVDSNDKFINMLNTENKLKIYIPHFFFKFILFILTKILKINSSFTYDGYLSLINDPNELEVKTNE